MSGEGGGAVIGAVILLGALPYILGAGAVAAGVYGLVKLGGAAVKAAERRHRETELKVSRCSAELSGVYSRLDEAMKKERAERDAFYRGLEEEMKGLAEDIRLTADATPDTEFIAGEAEKVKTAGSRAMKETREKEMRRIRAETEETERALMDEMKKIQKTATELVDWKASTAAARNQQRVAAEERLRDARASITLLQSLSASDPSDIAFKNNVAIMEERCRAAEEQLKNGFFESSVAQAETVITRSASLAVEHEKDMMDRDERLIAVEARLEGLLGELEKARHFTLEDELFGEREVDLDIYTQGEFARLEDEVRQLLDRIQSADASAFSLAEAMAILSHVEDELVPRADRLVAEGHKRLLQFFERVHALQVLSDHMLDNGYQMDWSAMPGDDPTQKTVISFVEPVSGNSISVALDEDESTEDLGSMAMKINFYYSDREVTEEEKQKVRSSMEEALRAAGLTGRLCCTGSVGREAADQSLKTKDAVRTTPVKKKVTV